MRFEEFIRKYPKRRNVLILSSGSSLLELEELYQKIPQTFFNDTYVICIKTSVNKVIDCGMNVDFCVLNGFIKNGSVDIENVKRNDIPVIAGNFSLEGKLKSNSDYIFKMKEDWEVFNVMEWVKKDIPGAFDLDIVNMNHNLGHIMCELALPLAILLCNENIFTLGWDIIYKNKMINYWNSNKKITDDLDNHVYSRNEYILEFTKFLSKYIRKHYKRNIYKLCPDSGVHIPYFNISTY